MPGGNLSTGNVQQPKWPVEVNYRTGYFLSVMLLTASMPLSKFTMSLFQFTTLAFWLWHLAPGYRNTASPHPAIDSVVAVGKALIEKFRRFFTDIPALVVASIFFLHVLGLLWSSDFHYAFKDLRTKLPIFILPLFLATGPRFTRRQFYWILAAFVAAVIGGSFYQFGLYLHSGNFREKHIGAHVSHIRYSLNAVFALFVMGWFIFSNALKGKPFRWLIAIPAIWLLGFLYFFNYRTGLVLLPITAAIALLVFTFQSKRQWLAWCAVALVLVASLVTVFVLKKSLNRVINHPKVYFAQLQAVTARGNLYMHDTVNLTTIGGEWPGLYICNKELDQAWASRSHRPLDSLDDKLQVLRYTLIKYLFSKQLRKDYDGVMALKDNEIRLVESGINDAQFDKPLKFSRQFEDFVNSFQNFKRTGNPNGSSLMQRYVYWNLSLHLIGEHSWLGVGTGDLPKAFATAYSTVKTIVDPIFRLRSHDQYLSIGVAFGIPGLLWFIFALLYPGIRRKGYQDYFYLVYSLIFLVSMFTEDTIETQEGVTFFALLTALLLFSRVCFPENIRKKDKDVCE